MRTHDQELGQAGWVGLGAKGTEVSGAGGGSSHTVLARGAHRGACEGAVGGTSRGNNGGAAPEGVVALAATVLDDARVRALTWEDDRLLLWLLVQGTTGALTRITVVYEEAVMTGMSIAEATRCTVLSQRVEARPDGSGRHRVWLYPEGEIVVDFAEVDVRKG